MLSQLEMQGKDELEGIIRQAGVVMWSHLLALACALLLLPAQALAGAKEKVVRELEQLIDRHGHGICIDCTLKLTFPSSPNGVYLVKGGGTDVWRRFGVPHCWRKPQGLIFGKRCGTTENIGVAARKRWKQSEEAKREAA
jgi:hypothetical protein